MRSSKTKILALVLACTISLSGFVTSFANASARSSDSGLGGADIVDSNWEDTEVLDSTPPPALMMSRAAPFTITSEAQLTAAFPDPVFRKEVFKKVKGYSGADLKSALASFGGTISAMRKEIKDIHGLELLRRAEKIDLRHNEIKDFSFLSMGDTYYETLVPNEDNGKNVAWDFGGNPFEKLPENFGGNLVIAQAGATHYDYATEPAKDRVFLRNTANESFDGVLQIGKCTVGASKRDVKVEKVEVPSIHGVKPLFAVTNYTDTTANIEGIRTSGEQRVAIGVYQELHYSTIDEYGTLTPGSQSFKYYISPKVLVYDRIILTHNDPKGQVTLTKTDDTAQKTPLEGAVYTLYSKRTNKPFKEGLKTEADGTCTVTGLPAGEYYFQETKAPLGYKLDKAPTKTFAIGTDGVELTGGKHEITVTASGKTEIAKHNEAFLAGKESDPIVLSLVKGTVGRVVVTYSSLDDEGGTPNLNAVTKEFKGATALQDAENDINEMKNANRITGSVAVEVTFTGESKVVKQEVAHTNAKTDKIDVSVQKIWEDDGDVLGLRPQSVEVSLLRNRATIQTLSLNAGNAWKGTFVELPINDGRGGKYTYSVKENAVAEYTSKLEQDPHSGLWIITNTVKKPASFDINGIKVWEGDEETDRPAGVMFELLQNGEPLWSAYASKKSGWKFEFWDLPIKDENGTKYRYTISEETIDGYAPVPNTVVTTPNTAGKSINVAITNVRIPGTLPPDKPDPSQSTFEINGTKQWVGDIAADRPARVTTGLYRNGTLLYKGQARAANGWTFHFWDLRLKDDAGNVYKYEIREEYVAGYSNRITPISAVKDGVATVTVTNTKNKPSGGGSDEPSPSLYPPEDITVEYDELPKPPDPLVPPAPPVKNPNTGRIISIDIMRRVGLLKWI